MSLDIKRFKTDQIVFSKTSKGEGPVIVLVGSRGTGKSFLVKDILYNHKTIPMGIVISGTEAVNGYFEKFVPKMFLHYEYTSDKVLNILKRQEMLMKEVKKNIDSYGKSDIDTRVFVILDDCLHDANGWSRDKYMKFLFVNGRHWKVMLIITMQYPMGIPPMLRCNVDYTFILREPNLTNRRRIFDNYAGMFPTFESFCQVMDSCTENYECLVVSNNVRSNKLEDQIFFYKAESHEPFKVGSKEFWEKSKDMEHDVSLFSGDASGPGVKSNRKGSTYSKVTKKY